MQAADRGMPGLGQNPWLAPRDGIVAGPACYGWKMQHSGPVVVSFGWSERVAAAGALALAPGENVLALLPVDLDAGLHFTSGNVVLTNQRLLAREKAGDVWAEWTLGPDHAPAGLKLHLSDHGGVGLLELCGAQARLAAWR